MLVLRSVIIAIFVNSCLAATIGHVHFDRYLRYESIQQYLNILNTSYPKIVRVYHYGESVEKRNLTYIRISTKANNNKRPLIFVDAGIHAREWIGVAQALYIIYQLVENPHNSAMIKNIDWLIIPLVNPDGYEYSHVHDRLWRKNRSKGKKCNGVDLNRNFDFQWLKGGASVRECSNTYAGKHPFSEPESIALSRLITDYSHRTQMYITLHAAAQSILYPWGYTTELPENNNDLFQLAAKVSNTLRNFNSSLFRVGSSANALYVDSGTSRDWAYATENIKLAYTIEMKPASVSNKSRYEFPTNNILPIVSEMFEGIKVFHVHIDNKYASFFTRLKRWLGLF